MGHRNERRCRQPGDDPNLKPTAVQQWLFSQIRRLIAKVFFPKKIVVFFCLFRLRNRDQDIFHSSHPQARLTPEPHADMGAIDLDQLGSISDAKLRFDLFNQTLVFIWLELDKRVANHSDRSET